MAFVEIPRYIEWDYDSMIAIEYERHGECNQCGECCKAYIQVQGKQDGGIGTDEKEAWSEVQVDQRRVFFKSKILQLDERICPSYNDKRGCKIYSDRYAICTTWPWSPCDVALTPFCSYWFDEIDSWKIE